MPCDINRAHYINENKTIICKQQQRALKTKNFWISELKSEIVSAIPPDIEYIQRKNISLP